MALTFPLALLACLAVLCTTAALGLYVNITILQSATTKAADNFYILPEVVRSRKLRESHARIYFVFEPTAVCLDGSPPAYHLHPGHGGGLSSWIIVLDVSYYVLLNASYLLIYFSFLTIYVLLY